MPCARVGYAPKAHRIVCGITHYRRPSRRQNHLAYGHRYAYGVIRHLAALFLKAHRNRRTFTRMKLS